MPQHRFDCRMVHYPARDAALNLRQPEHRPVESQDHPMARHSPAKAKYSKKAQAKIATVMEEHAAGTLKSSSGHKVTSRKQATAIALSEARQQGLKVPKRKKKG